MQLYYGSKESWTFNLKNKSDGTTYEIPEGFTLKALIKQDFKPNSPILFEQELDNTFTMYLTYSSYDKLKIGEYYVIELDLIDDTTGEYLPPLFQDKIEIKGVAYGK